MAHEPINIRTSDDEPITTGAIVRIGAVAVGAVGIIASSAYAFASQRADQTALHAADAQLSAQMQEYRAAQDKRSDAFEARQLSSDRTIADLSAKLDTVTTILNRIDKKLNQP